VAVGAVMLAIPASAVALTVGSADAQSALQVSLDHQHLNYGQRLTITGNASSAARGQRLWLDYEPAGGSWHAISSTNVDANGRFRLVTTPRQTGAVRVVGGATTASTTGSIAAITPSPPRPVSVKALFKAPLGPIDALTGQSVEESGRLVPGAAGRLVKLQYGTGHGWNTLTTARTGGNGHFDLRYSPGSTGQQFVRISFPGDARNGHVATQIVPLTTYRQSVASWYDDSGATACGFHAGMGVANRDLPCGTKVTFHYNGRSVTATVDDRGPFVGGRDWDLNQNVAGALGFGGVDTVWSSM
jgi:hypothetical protein